MKLESTFFNKKIRARILNNVEKSEQAGKVRDNIVEMAGNWAVLSDEELWDLMFGNSIMRSWSVWSDGFCPSCKKDVVMYAWEADPANHPWKMQCPHCGELFPKNDFYSYYKSGLNDRGVFDFELADKSLLFNCEHPDRDDPLYKFGVDDGNGYSDGKNNWRFIGTYLIYGQWKRLILHALYWLSAAYILTEDRTYAHKAGVLLDRIADLYPTFDFVKDGLLYEGKNICPGYVSYSVDACFESKELIIAYDRVFDGIRDDSELIAFLSEKSRNYKGIAQKNTFEDIQRNIETNILQHVLDNPDKTDCNYPNTDAAYAIARMVMSWNDNREDIMNFIRKMVIRTTAVDGTTGEKGLATYSAWTLRVFAEFLGLCCFADDNFLKKIYEEFPRIYQTYRFHLDTWCLGKYYPHVGDTGKFAQPVESYIGLSLYRNIGIEPSMFTFLWKLYELTADNDFIKIMYTHNENSVKDLPYDLMAENPAAVREKVLQLIETEGTELSSFSVNKREWGLAILKSGRGEDSRAVWIHYDSLRDHSHIDAMNIGLYAKGMDLMPDFGYPPVQYGGWFTPQVYWYQNTASHNTVMVDGEDQKDIKGYKPNTNLWCIGDAFKAIRVSEPRFVNGKQYERTVVLADISEKDSYVFDVFRVAGGREHARLMHSGQSTMDLKGLTLEKTNDFENYGIMKNFKVDMEPAEGWSVDWKLKPGKNAPEGSNTAEAVHLNYYDVTRKAEVYAAEAWVALDGYNSIDEDWIPRLMLRRKCGGEGDNLLQTTFAGIIEPCCGQTNISAVKRLELGYEGKGAAACGRCDADIAVQIDFRDGRSDLVISADVEDPAGCKGGLQGLRLMQNDWKVSTDCELLLLRKSRDGRLERIAACGGSYLRIGEDIINLDGPDGFSEIAY